MPVHPSHQLYAPVMMEAASLCEVISRSSGSYSALLLFQASRQIFVQGNYLGDVVVQLSDQVNVPGQPLRGPNLVVIVDLGYQQPSQAIQGQHCRLQHKTTASQHPLLLVLFKVVLYKVELF